MENLHLELAALMTERQILEAQEAEALMHYEDLHWEMVEEAIEPLTEEETIVLLRAQDLVDDARIALDLVSQRIDQLLRLI